MRRARLLLLLGLVGLLTAGLAAPAQAAKRQVPFGFFGTVFNPGAYQQLNDLALEAQMASMARNGVESVRISIDWASTEATPGVYDWSRTDRLVAAAARHRLQVFATVLYTPRWASSRPNGGPDGKPSYLYVPRNPNTFGNFMRTVIRRYGPRGSFFRANRRLPRNPVRQWQIWNEAAADFFFASRPWPRNYVRLLKPAYRAIKRADRGATVIMAGKAGVTAGPPWVQLDQVYRAGAKGFFDAVALHYFSVAPSVRTTVSDTLRVAQLARQRMNRRGDRRKKIYFTELTWTAAKNRIPNREEFGFETTPRGQQQRLDAAFSRLARERRRLGIGKVLWYTWASEYEPRIISGGPGNLTFQYSGLNKLLNGRVTTLPVLRTYARVAARFQGCRKTNNARRCRR